MVAGTLWSQSAAIQRPDLGPHVDRRRGWRVTCRWTCGRCPFYAQENAFMTAGSGAPLVSVLTPVYNGAEYLVQCIESVLGQTLKDFEYIIVNNCSTDGTLDIARRYAALDSRIKVHDNTEFLEVIANHNLAFSLMSPAAKYCKIVSADDYIFPDCLEKLVAFAEAHPSVGMVSSYELAG